MSDVKKGEEDGGKLAEILAHLKSDSAANKEWKDAFGRRMDAMEEGRKADAARLDAVCTKMDAAEEMMDAAKKDAAKADAARKDAEEEEKKKDAAKADAAKKDAEASGKEKTGAEEEDKRDAARKDAAGGHIDIDARIAAAISAAVPKPLAEDERQRFVATQAKWEPLAQMFGDHAGRYLDGETHDQYRRRLIGKYKPHSRDWKEVDISAFADKALDVVEAKIYADATQAAQHPTDLPDNTLRMVTRADQAGRSHISFVGSEKAAWLPFCNPDRRGRINTRFARD